MTNDLADKNVKFKTSTLNNLTDKNVMFKIVDTSKSIVFPLTND